MGKETNTPETIPKKSRKAKIAAVAGGVLMLTACEDPTYLSEDTPYHYEGTVTHLSIDEPDTNFQPSGLPGGGYFYTERGGNRYLASYEVEVCDNTTNNGPDKCDEFQFEELDQADWENVELGDYIVIDGQEDNGRAHTENVEVEDRTPG